MSLQFWQGIRIIGWTVLLIYFILKLIEVEENWYPLSEKKEEILRTGIGAIGTFLVLLGYLMLSL